MEERAIVYKVSYQGVDKIIGSEKAIRDEIKKTKKERDAIASDSRLSSTERVQQLEKQDKKLGQLQASQIALRKQGRKNKDAALSDSKSLVGAYDRQSAKLRVIRNELKDLAVKRELGLEFDVSRFDKLNKEVTELDGLLKKVDASAGQFQRNVGNYPRVLQGFSTALAGLGVGLGFSEIGQGLRRGFDSAVEFSSSLADLSAITGITGDDLKSLESDINDLTDVQLKSGERIKTSASDIAEAYKLIGSAKPELLDNQAALTDLTEKAIILSKASGDDLPTATKNYADALNFLNLPLSEADRLLNALAAASQKGAKEIPFVNDALAKFGGLAASFKIEPEESIAAIETLGKVIPEASSVGTNLRNVLLVLNKEAQTNGRVFNSISEELGFYGDKVNDAVFLEEKFGKQNLLAAQTLIAQKDSLEELTGAITGTNTAYDQAAIKSDNLATDVENLSVAISGSLRNLVEANSEGLRPFIRSITELIPKLLQNIDVIGKVAAGLAIIALRTKITTALEITAIATRKAASVAWSVLTGKIKIATIAQRAFNLVKSANAIGLIAAAVTAAYVAYQVFSGEVDKASESQLKLKKSISDTNVELVKEERQVESLFKVLKSDTSSRKEQQKAREDLLRLYPDYLKGINLETASVTQLDEAQTKLVSSIRAATIERQRSEAVGKLIDKQVRLELELNEALKERSSITNNALSDSRFQQDLNNPVRDIEAALGFVSDEIKTINDAFNDAFGEAPNNISDEPIKDFSKDLAKSKEEAEELKKSIEDIVKVVESFEGDNTGLQLFERARKEAESLEKLFSDIEKRAKALPDIAPQAGSPESALDPNSDLSDALTKLSIEKSARLANEVETIEELERLNQEFRAKELQAKLDNEIVGKEERLKIEDEIRKINEDRDRDERIAKTELVLSYLQQGAELFSQFLDNQSQKRLDANEAARDKELSQENLTEDQKEKINAKYDKIREKEEEKAAKQRKAIAITESLIATALAVVKALPNLPLSITAGVIGAAQTAIIASSQFADGGVLEDGVLRGNSHVNGGVKFMYNGQLMEAEGGETIINKRSSSLFRKQLSDINVAGGGKRFALGGSIGDVSQFIPRGAIESNLRSQTLRIDIDAKQLGKDIARSVQNELNGLDSLGDDIANKVGEALEETVLTIQSELNRNQRQG